MDNRSLSHTRWKCQYHIVFIPKYRKRILYGRLREDVKEIISTLCKYRKVDIIAGAVCKDHVHLSVAIPPKESISDFMGYLKGKSSLMIYEKYPELRYKYRNREFWCRGYYVDTAGKNAKKIEEYIRHQLDEDKAGEQLTMGNFEKTRLRVASKKPFAAARPYQCYVTRAASNIGLCPHLKYPRLRRGIFIVIENPRL